MATSFIPDINQLIECLWRPPGISRKALRHLGAHLDPQQFFSRTESSLTHRYKLLSESGLKALKKAHRMREGWASDYLSFRDPRFPARLERLADPPCGFYFHGNLQALERPQPWIGVVGTRAASSEAIRFCEHLVSSLKPCSPIIVSGLAAGIDGAAHRAALKGGIPTIGVLGTSLDRIYPARHRPLAREMMEEGLVLSEFAPRSETNPWNFPQRNRLIAALSDLLIVVEAPEKSGALITADFALDLGIEIYAVPGSVSSPQNRGCHRLIQQGAKLLMDPEEILMDLGLAPKGPSPGALRLDSLSEEQSKLLKIIGYQVAHVDKIVDMSHLPTPQVLRVLQGLVIEGWLEELPGKSYRLPADVGALLLKS